MLKTIQKIHFGSSSLLCSIFQACWWSWKPLNPPFVMPCHRLCGIYNLEEKKCFHRDSFTMIPSAAKTNTVYSCVSFSDGAMLQANGTHKNQMGQAEGMYTHTHTLTLPLAFLLRCRTLFSLNLLNCEQALSGFPSCLHGNHSVRPSCLSCLAHYSLSVFVVETKVVFSELFSSFKTFAKAE